MKEREFSDEVHNEITSKVEEWISGCEHTIGYKQLPENVRDVFDMIVSSFAEFMYSYHLLPPERWTAKGLEDVLINIFPSKIISTPSLFTAVEPALAVFIAYLNGIGVIKNDGPMQNRLKAVAPRMCSLAVDESNFSPIKQIMMRGIEQGIDINDIDELNEWLENTDFSELLEDDEEDDETVYGEITGPTVEQWRDLYGIAQKIRQQEPWEFLWDMDLITIMPPGYDEPMYCSVMGRDGECYAIAVYPGYDAIRSYFRLLSKPDNEMPFIAGFEQDCLMLNFGNREEVDAKDREVYTKLGLKFRGRNEWIYFRAHMPGFFPWHIDTKQADVLIQTLQNLYLACEPLKTGEFESNFGEGNTLMRAYSQEKGGWYNAFEKMPPIPFIDKRMVIRDDLLIARLKKQKRINQHIEFDSVYIPIPVQETKDTRPYLPRLTVIMDRESGILLTQDMSDMKADTDSAIMDMIIEYIETNGRPSSIYVRNNQLQSYIGDLCQKIEIKLIVGENMSATDEFLKHMMDHFM